MRCHVTPYYARAILSLALPLPRPRPMEHPGAATDRAQPFALRPLQQNDADNGERQHEVGNENRGAHPPPPSNVRSKPSTSHGTMPGLEKEGGDCPLLQGVPPPTGG